MNAGELSKELRSIPQDMEVVLIVGNRAFPVERVTDTYNKDRFHRGRVALIIAAGALS